MRTLERFTYVNTQRKLEVTITLRVNDSCVDAEDRYNAVRAAAYGAIGRHVERRADALREDVMKHDLNILSRDFERDLDLGSPKVLRKVAVDIWEAISDICDASDSDAGIPSLSAVNLESVVVAVTPQGDVAGVVEVEVTL